MRVLERVVAIPYALDGDVLRIAVADPGDVQGIDELRLATPHQLELAVATRDEILEQVGRMARASTASAVPTVLEGKELELEEDFLPETDLEADDGLSDEPLVRLVNSILFQAAEDGASDIHFEPQEDALSVRFRVDGILRETQRIPRSTAAGVITRFKVLAKLDIAERRKPQDGRISRERGGRGTQARRSRRDAADCVRRVGRPPSPRPVEQAADDGRARPLRRDAGWSCARSSSGRRARCLSPARRAPARRRRSSPS